MYQVQKRDGKIVEFDITKISNAIKMAFDAQQRQYNDSLIDFLALKVTADFEPHIKDGLIAVEDIQDCVESVLIKAGYDDVAKAYILYRRQREKLRNINSTMLDYKSIVDNYLNVSDWRVKENSTVTYSVGGLILSNSGAITANYWLSEIYDDEVANAHKNADIHLHDLSMLTGYCAGWSLKQLIQEGLGGVPGKISSSPASHLSTLCNQMVNFLGIMQNEWAGAQAFSSFDTYLAPFVKVDNLTYKEVKQCVQSFVYGVNTPSRWGTQAPFTNITLDWTVPEDLKDMKAIVGGKEQDFTYGDCKKEMDMVNKAFIELMIEGDCNGRGFQYPIPTYSITRDFDWSETENNKLLFEMTAKYGTPYFSNYINSDMEPSDVRSMCCRLRLDLRELRKKSGGFFGSGESTGSIGVVTINMPRIAYLSATPEEFYKRLDHMMDIAARSLDVKRRVISKLLEEGLYPYTKRYLGGFSNHFSTIGLVGMNEVGLNAKWLQADMTHKETQQFAIDVLNHMRERLSDYQEQYGDLFNLEATPAESTAFRLAKHDVKRFGDIITAADCGGTPYYTNSSHLPVGYTEDVFAALDVQDELQTLYTSGTVFHAFLGEKLPDWKAAATLVRTIAENYKLPYYTMSPTYSICRNHGYIAGEVSVCPECGERTEVYSRITGYYRPVQNWNEGKVQEYKQRKTYDIGASFSKHSEKNIEEPLKNVEPAAEVADQGVELSPEAAAAVAESFAVPAAESIDPAVAAAGVCVPVAEAAAEIGTPIVEKALGFESPAEEPKIDIPADPFAATIAPAVEEAENAAEEAAEEAGEAAEAVEEAVEEAAEGVTEAAEEVAEAAEEIVEAAAEDAEEVAEAAEEAVEQAAENVEAEAAEPAEEKKPSHIAAAVAAIAAAFSLKPKAKAEQAADVVEKAVEEVAEAAGDAVEDAVEQAAEAVEDAAAEIAEAPAEIETVMEEAAGEAASVIENIDTGAEEAVAEIEAAAESFTEGGTAAAEKLAENFEEQAIEELTEAVHEAAEAVEAPIAEEAEAAIPAEPEAIPAASAERAPVTRIADKAAALAALYESAEDTTETAVAEAVSEVKSEAEKAEDFIINAAEATAEALDFEAKPQTEPVAEEFAAEPEATVEEPAAEEAAPEALAEPEPAPAEEPAAQTPATAPAEPAAQAAEPVEDRAEALAKQYEAAEPEAPVEEPVAEEAAPEAPIESEAAPAEEPAAEEPAIEEPAAEPEPTPSETPAAAPADPVAEAAVAEPVEDRAEALARQYEAAETEAPVEEPVAEEAAPEAPAEEPATEESVAEPEVQAEPEPAPAEEAAPDTPAAEPEPTPSETPAAVPAEPAVEEPATPAEPEKPAVPQKRFLLFTTRTCPNCAVIKEFLAQQGTEYELILAEEHRELARRLGIMQAPTAVIIEGNTATKYIGVSKIKNYVLSQNS